MWPGEGKTGAVLVLWPRLLELNMHFKEQLFFEGFWHVFCVLIHQIFGKKVPETFGFSQPPPPFSTQNSKIVGAQKVPQNFWIALEPLPPYGKNP